MDDAQRGGPEMAALMDERTVLSRPGRRVPRGACWASASALVAVPDVLPHLESGALRRLLPRWYADAGAISLYYAHRTLMPAKTRAFVDYVGEVVPRASGSPSASPAASAD